MTFCRRAVFFENKKTTIQDAAHLIVLYQIRGRDGGKGDREGERERGREVGGRVGWVEVR